MTKPVRYPALLLDKQKCLRNISRMAEKARRNNLIFRPHFKTHQSALIGEWFREAGISAITVSSLWMAEYFAGHGWNDITVAFPVNVREADRINRLSKRISVNLVVDSAIAVQMLDCRLDRPVNAFVKIDAGYGRAGLPSDDLESLDILMEITGNARNFIPAGFLVHSGHSYQAQSKREILDIHRDSVQKLLLLKKIFEPEYPGLLFSIGDTPTCSIADDFNGIDEIRPGNFVFFDAMQMELGACTENDIAVALACPVVSMYTNRNEILVHAGAVHLSKEKITHRKFGRFFGYVAYLTETGWEAILPDTYVSSLSQEHGIIRTTTEILRRVHTGDLLAIIPVHSCLACDLMRVYHTTGGKEIEMMAKLYNEDAKMNL